MSGVWRTRQPEPDDAARRNNVILLIILLGIGTFLLLFLVAKWIDIETGRCLDCIHAKYGISDYDVEFHRWVGRVMVPGLVIEWFWLIASVIRSRVPTDRTVVGTICWFFIAVPALVVL